MSTNSSSEMPAEPLAGTAEDEFLFRKRKHAAHGDFVSGLNLTAMMDILTILLVYLIKIYAEAPDNITLNDDLRPPSSSSPDNMVPAVSVLISKTAILVDQKKIVDVVEGKVITEEGTASYQPLAEALDKRVEVIRAIEVRGGSPFDGNLMIIADEDTPYDLISNVLFQAGQAEFTSFRLVVRKK